MDRCPLAALNKDACDAVGVWESCESGFGGGYLPSQLLDETQYALNVRQIVLKEKHKIEKLKSKKGSNGRNN